MEKPHGRNKRVVSGTARVGKGRRVSPGGGRVGGDMGGRPGGQSFSGGRSYNGERSGVGNAAAGLGLLGLFAILPKKLRRVLVVVLAVVLVFSLLRSCGRSSASSYDSGSGSLFESLFGLGGGYQENTYGGDSYDSSYDSGYSSYDTSAVSDTAGDSPFNSLFSGNSYTSSDGGGQTSTVAAPAAQSTETDSTVSNLARDKRYVPRGDGRDTVTVMVYMCGTDLESKYGMATSDLSEMTKANLSDKVNVIVETGGCRSWKNNIVSNSVNQIYRVKSGGLETLNTNAGTAAMTDPRNLTDFIDFCEENYPADRNILILWDHGGGSLSGYGYDEKRTGSGSMTLSKINGALKDAGCVFDWIGFDACLMATLENAMVCDDYADYLIASEEVEPGTGWYYTDWLTDLSRNTSISTLELSKSIIDDYMTACRKSGSKVTLSVVDLAELSGTVPEAFRAFSVSTNELIGGDAYKQVSDARAGVRQFSQSSRINQVDLTDLALRIGTDEAKALAEALQGCVKYNGSTISRSYGISIFFPYESMNTVSSAVSTYNNLGMDEEYTKCIQSFASLEYGGQIGSSASQSSGYGSYSDILEQLLGSYTGSSSPVDSLYGSSSGGSYSSYGSSSDYGSYGGSSGSISASDLIGILSAFSGRSMPSEYSWVDTELIAANAESIAAKSLDPARLTATEKNGQSVLSLTDEEWALIQSVELNVFVDDGEGYIDLGLDNVFQFDGNDLLLSYDGTWLTLDGQAVAYYLVTDMQNDDGSWTTVGRIPAILNGDYVNLRVVFDDDAPYGAVTGAYPLYAQGETDTAAKGDVAIAEGDSIEFLCDYYGYDGSYSASYTLGSALTVGSGPMELNNMDIDADNVSVTYRLTDIYGNHYWVPVS